MDGDGHVDVVAAGELAVRVLWWKNNGSGGFSRVGEWTWGDPSSSVVAIEDANNDGHLDIWILNDPRTGTGGLEDMRILIAYGDGTGFAEPVEKIGDTVPDASRNTYVWDLNSDGHLDIIAGEKVYLADGQGSFLAGVSNSGIDFDNQYDKGLVAADLDMDGALDLLIETHTASGEVVHILWNQGAGSFSGPELLVMESGKSVESFVILPDLLGLLAPSLLVMYSEEINEVDHYELVLYQQNESGAYQSVFTLDLAENDGENHLQPFTLFCDAVSGRIFLTTWGSLIDTMGRKIFMRVSEIQLVGQSLSERQLLDAPGFILQPPIAGEDINGDGVADLFLPLSALDSTYGSMYSQLVWHEGDNDGSVQATPHSISGAALHRQLYYAGDMDGDGDTDILTGGRPPLTSSGGIESLALWKNGVIPGEFECTGIMGSYDLIQVIHVRDIVGVVPGLSGGEEEAGWLTAEWPEGEMDMLVKTFRYTNAGGSSGTSRIEWLLQAGDGSFHWFPVTEEHATTSHRFSREKTTYANWDADGFADLIIDDRGAYDGDSRSVSWRKGTQYDWGSLQPIVQNLEADAELIDMDWDGDLDILTYGTLFGSLGSYWYENNGSGAATASFALPVKIQRLGADLDGDGHEDFSSYLSSGNVYYLARAGVTFNAHASLVASHFLDMDNDGDLDEVFVTSGGFTIGYSQIGWFENKGVGIGSPLEIGFEGIFGEGYHVVAPADFFALRDQMLFGDIDDDGVKDLIVCSGKHERLEWFEISTTPEPAAFTQWINGHGLTGSSAGLLEDWDGDKVLNWEEFAFGSNPGIKDSGAPGRPQMVRDESGLAYVFNRRTDAAGYGLSYQHYRSEDLLSWELWSPVHNVSPHTANYERVIFRIGSEKDFEFYKTKLTLEAAP